MTWCQCSFWADVGLYGSDGYLDESCIKAIFKRSMWNASITSRGSANTHTDSHAHPTHTNVLPHPFHVSFVCLCGCVG